MDSIVKLRLRISLLLGLLALALSGATAQADPLLPDLVAVHLDGTALQGDWQALQIWGSLSAEVAN